MARYAEITRVTMIDQMGRILANIAGGLIPGIRFSMAGEANSVYLTFDDGPHPETTPRILALLAKHDARATFFCLGRNAEKYPAVFDSIIEGGHAVGNHSWSHLNGWVTPTGKYLEDVQRASGVISSKLFRPPYGRITPGQYRQLRKKYEIIMWTRQFADYRPGFNPGKTSLKGTLPGDILVLHDSPSTISATIPLMDRLFSTFPASFGKPCLIINGKSPFQAIIQ
jgi:peptidoglycan-N-acetylglucosamine deacetylase